MSQCRCRFLRVPSRGCHLLRCIRLDWVQLEAHVELFQDVVEGEHMGTDAGVLEALASQALELARIAPAGWDGVLLVHCEDDVE